MGLWQRFRNLFHPRGADKVMRILQGLALVDDHLDERELDFLRAFARRWGFDPDDALAVKGTSRPTTTHDSLRAAMLDYLATRPPRDQAHQLRDVLTALVTIDGKICKHEELMLDELGGMIDAYVSGEPSR